MRRRHIIALLALLPMIPRSLAQTRGRVPVVGFLGLASEQADRIQGYSRAAEKQRRS